MAFYDSIFSALGLSGWCGEAGDGAPLSMADLMAKAGGDEAKGEFFPFPSLDNLNESCSSVLQSRDVTKGIEEGFLAAKPALKTVLDPITQPLSWLLDGADLGCDLLLGFTVKTCNYFCIHFNHVAGSCGPLRCRNADPIDHLCLYKHLCIVGCSRWHCHVEIGSPAKIHRADT